MLIPSLTGNRIRHTPESSRLPAAAILLYTFFRFLQRFFRENLCFARLHHEKSSKILLLASMVVSVAMPVVVGVFLVLQVAKRLVTMFAYPFLLDRRMINAQRV